MPLIKAGTQLGRYEVLGEVGKGGMSVVYRAQDPQLKRDVAIKVLHDFLMSEWLHLVQHLYQIKLEQHYKHHGI